jgi:putative membrane protein
MGFEPINKTDHRLIRTLLNSSSYTTFDNNSTSIALIGFGFAIARFGLFLRQLQSTLTQQEYSADPIFNSENLGISLVVFGISIIAIAAWRYNQVLEQIERGDYRPSRLLIWIVTAVVMILGLLSIPLVLLRTKLPNAPATPMPPQSRRSF